jgi:hypothetical protein
MLVWKGWGLMALGIPLLCSLLIEAALNSLYGDNYYKTSDWEMPLVLIVSALFVYSFGTHMNNKPGRILIDPENNETVELKRTHSMFWIPLQYWSVIIIAVSIWMYLDNIGMIYQK